MERNLKKVTRGRKKNGEVKSCRGMVKTRRKRQESESGHFVKKKIKLPERNLNELLNKQNSLTSISLKKNKNTSEQKIKRWPAI